MDLKQLREQGAFVKAPPVPVEVTWTRRDEDTGEERSDTFTVFVRRMSVGWFDRVVGVTQSGTPRSRTALLISEGVLFGENGSEQMKYEDAYLLNFGLASVLLEAFNKVNGREGEPDPKD